MQANDFEMFSDTWRVAHEVMAGGKILSSAALSMIFDALSDYPLAIIQQAVKHHMATAKFAPTPHDILALLTVKTARLHADEAWAIANFPETDTVVWTEDMAAAHAIAAPLLHDGDKIGGRMAFKAAYNRICAENANVPVRWVVSVGFDKSRIESAVTTAVRLGRLEPSAAQRYLPAPNHQAFLEAKTTAEKPNSAVLENLAKVKKSLLAGSVRTEKRMALLERELAGNPDPYQRYLLESELELLRDSHDSQKEAEVVQQQREAFVARKAEAVQFAKAEIAKAKKLKAVAA